MNSIPPYPGDIPIPHGQSPRTCTRCEKTFPATTDYFLSSKGKKSSSTGLNPRCKWCNQRDENKRPPVPEKDPTKRQCTQCEKRFPATEEFFGTRKSRSSKGGPPRLLSHCRSCHNDIRTNFYHRHKDDKHEEWTRKQREWWTKNQDRKNELYRNWYHTHPEQARSHNQERYSRRKDIPGKLTAQEIQEKLKAQKYACYYCGNKFKKRKDGMYKYEIEHTVPISRTESGPRHDVNFVVLSCTPCNDSKKARLPHEWPQGGRLL